MHCVTFHLHEWRGPRDFRSPVYVVFYDRDGAPVAYSEDGEHIFLFGGEAIAYLEDDAVYSYRGELKGWFESGWLRDKDGRCVAFSEYATGGPLRADMKPEPQRALKQSLPTRERQDPRALRPIHSNCWSVLTTIQFFDHPLHRWPGGMGEALNLRRG